MAAISLFWDHNMAAVTSCENTINSYISYQFINLSLLSFFMSSDLRIYRKVLLGTVLIVDNTIQLQTALT